MAGLQLSGLVSGFDWKSLVDQLMTLERAPIDRIEREQTRNTQKSDALSLLGTKLASLQTAVDDLGTANQFYGRTAASTTSGSTWSTTAAASTATGSYAIAVSRLATASTLQGSSDIGLGLSTTTDVSGITLATMPTGLAATAGTFTVNGKQVTVALTDTLSSVFTAISTATSGAVTAAYDPVTDKVTLSGTGTIVLGAANDTSNFLTALKLGNNNSSTVTSSAALGAAKTTSVLASANLRTAITAVDGTGAGSFTINGVSISYNVNSDSLSALISRINASTAGVTARFDALNDRLTLTNNATGDLGVNVSEAAGGVLGALGLTSGTTLTRGQTAQFTVNGSSTLASNSNTLDASVHGITGLSVTVDAAATQTIQVSADTSTMKAKIQAFIDKFNSVQLYIGDKSKITTANGKVTAAILADNREVQNWSDKLRSMAFSAVSGVSGTIQRLENLGIDFNGSTDQLVIKDSAKLDAALRDHATDVTNFFQTTTTGFAKSMGSYLTNIISSNTDQQTAFTNTNTKLGKQIADIERRLTQQRELLTSSFIAMETAQSRIKQQSTALDNAFGTNKKTT